MSAGRPNRARPPTRAHAPTRWSARVAPSRRSSCCGRPTSRSPIPSSSDGWPWPATRRSPSSPADVGFDAVADAGVRSRHRRARPHPRAGARRARPRSRAPPHPRATASVRVQRSARHRNWSTSSSTGIDRALEMRAEGRELVAAADDLVVQPAAAAAGRGQGARPPLGRRLRRHPHLRFAPDALPPVRGLRGGRPPRRRHRLPRRTAGPRAPTSARCAGCRSPPTPTGTRTEPSSATASAPSTSGSRCRTAASTRPASTSLPRRFDHVVETGTGGAIFDWAVGPAIVETPRGRRTRPYDHSSRRATRCSSTTSSCTAPPSSPTMVRPRYADRVLVLRAVRPTRRPGPARLVTPARSSVEGQGEGGPATASRQDGAVRLRKPPLLKVTV